MKNTESIFTKVESILANGSTRGCGLRYVMWGTTPQGESMKFETEKQQHQQQGEN